MVRIPLFGPFAAGSPQKLVELAFDRLPNGLGASRTAVSGPRGVAEHFFIHLLAGTARPRAAAEGSAAARELFAVITIHLTSAFQTTEKLSEAADVRLRGWCASSDSENAPDPWSESVVRSALKNPHLIVVLALMVVVGVTSYQKIPADLLPIFKTPAVQIATFYPGMPAEVMERDIISRLKRWTGRSVGSEHREAKAMPGVCKPQVSGVSIPAEAN